MSDLPSRGDVSGWLNPVADYSPEAAVLHAYAARQLLDGESGVVVTRGDLAYMTGWWSIAEELGVDPNADGRFVILAIGDPE